MSQEELMNNIKPNSNKYKMEKKAAEEQKVKKVVNGPVKTRKKGIGEKFAELIFGATLKEVINSIIYDQLIPKGKDMFLDIVSNGLEILFYGEPRRKKSKNSSGDRVSYSTYYKSENNKPQTRESGTSNYGYKEIVLDTRGDAEEVLDVLTEACSVYGQVSVADLYDAVGITGNFTDNKYGWMDMKDAKVRRVPEGYIIDLPRPYLLD